MHAQSFFCAHTPGHTLCMNYVTGTSLLVSSSVSGKQQLYSSPKVNKNIQQRGTLKALVARHSPLLCCNAKLSASLHKRSIRTDRPLVEPESSKLAGC